jgi:ubiquinone/menaquinone biosynthesis C-methylase UbiE
MVEIAKTYDRQGVLRFPLMPGAQETAWRYMFDWTVAGEALHCAPGDRVLEFGSGPSFASELFNRLGYHTVALDLDPDILVFAQERLTLDRRLDPERAHFVAGDGQRLPFGDATFDGVICLNALHHMPDYGAALSEIRRILRPGCRAVFSEPGSEHSQSPLSQLATQQYGAVEKSIVLEEILRLACAAGFEELLLKPYVYPHLVELDYRQLSPFRLNLASARFTRPYEIADFMEKSHAIFCLTTPGQRPLTSARPGQLCAQIVIDGLPHAMIPGQSVAVCATIRNTGDTLWLSAPREFGGHVTMGVKLCAADGRLITDMLGRTLLPRDLPPGEEVEVHIAFHLPEALPPGQYRLRFDLVDEQVAWFEELGSAVAEHTFWIGDATNGSLIPKASAAQSAPASSLHALSRSAGAAPAEIGSRHSSDRLLAPIARAIRDLLRPGHHD